jgi:hypothetical protein
MSAAAQCRATAPPATGALPPRASVPARDTEAAAARADHAHAVGDRFAAPQPVYDVVIDRWGRLKADIARGAQLRHGWGPQ